MQATTTDTATAAMEKEKGLRAELDELRRRYGSDSDNGDVLDWLHCFLSDPLNQTAHAVLAIFLRNGGYDFQESVRLLEGLAEVYAKEKGVLS